ncbi:MAG: xanthine dehydrogenase family protein molybdopterin-binding subunit [Deltaproteobacteria bacterium]|nr:xanthine dehydrogenase family protein molybdopterin-binding subunit [Deltaproteobacteria bacterium]
MTGAHVIGSPVPRVEGPLKVRGEARYSADITLPGMLWAKFLRSPYPHARVLSVDVSRARALRGVKAVLTGADIPPRLYGRRLRDMPFLARDRVRFIGERVAAVAAEDPDVAEEALGLIEVEHEELPAVFDPEAAMQPGAPILHEALATYEGLPAPPPDIPNVHSLARWSMGDLAQGFREAHRVFEHSFRTPFVHQGYLEPHAGVVEVDGSGRLQVWATNKTPFVLRKHLSESLDLPEEMITVQPIYLGADFGGKGSVMDLPLCYYLVQRTGRPVKAVMSYVEELTAANPRHASVITLRTGVTRDGRFCARHARAIFNSGAYGAMKPTPFVNLGGAAAGGGVYRIPHLQIDAYSVYTNGVPCGHMRAPGEPQMIFAVESQTDMIAAELGVDPLEFRLRNGLAEGDPLVTGHRLTHVRLRQTLEAAGRAIGWGTPKPGPCIGRGLAAGERHVGIGQGSAEVALELNGRVRVLTGVPDTGTGAPTVLRQIVAEVLALPLGQVEVAMGSTDQLPPDSGAGGSRVTHVVGRAAWQAATTMRRRVLERAAQELTLPAEKLDLRDGWIVADGTRRLSLDEVTKRHGPLQVVETYVADHYAALTSFSVQAAEVEVDPESGQVHLRRLVTAHDVGRVLNPLTHQGQIEGGAIQGLGYALMENLVIEEGRVAASHLGEYKLPTIKDIPPLETVLLEEPGGPVPFEGKAIGEHSISTVAPAVANAVFDAVGVRITDLPITAEKIHQALRARPAPTR